MKILIVDDNLDFAEMLSDTLTPAGHECVVAINGERGLELADRLDVDLVFMDVMLPGLSGIETAQRLLASRPGIPVVLITGYTEEQVLSQAPANVTAVLLKPFSVEALRRIVAKASAARQG